MKIARLSRAKGAPIENLDAPLAPKISKPLLNFFNRYSVAFLKRHFHSIRLLKNGALRDPEDEPLVIYLNHSSWWDPLVCLFLASRFLPARDSYGPIESSALQRYKFFRRLGFFGVENGTRRGATQFLESARAILATKTSALWLTPQGEFVDDRARPLQFQRGLGHLAARIDHAAFIPLAIEYSFWEERMPEVMIAFGTPLIFDEQRRLDPDEASQLFESALTSVQDELAAAAQRRNPEEWSNLLRGSAGSSHVYDLWRWLRAKLRGEKFRAAHSDL